MPQEGRGLGDTAEPAMFHIQPEVQPPSAGHSMEVQTHGYCHSHPSTQPSYPASLGTGSAICLGHPSQPAPVESQP